MDQQTTAQEEKTLPSVLLSDCASTMSSECVCMLEMETNPKWLSWAIRELFRSQVSWTLIIDKRLFTHSNVWVEAEQGSWISWILIYCNVQSVLIKTANPPCCFVSEQSRRDSLRRLFLSLRWRFPHSTGVTNKDLNPNQTVHSKFIDDSNELCPHLKSTSVVSHVKVQESFIF